MRFSLRQSALITVSCLLISLFVFPQNLVAQQVVSPDDIHKELVNATQNRQSNLEKAKSLFSSEAGQRALKSAKMTTAQVEGAISTLSDAELARLAARANNLESDFAGGRISDRDLLLIILGIAALILIIVAVR
jgi:hypothetical protein